MSLTTEAQTYLGSFEGVSEVVEYNGYVYFTPWERDEEATELWKTDGTPEGTELVFKLRDRYYSYLRDLTIYDGHLYFSAYDPFEGNELFKSDGTTAGTSILKNINESTGNDKSSNPRFLTVLNDHLYFSTSHMQGIWRTDGTSEGTEIAYGTNSHIGDLKTSGDYIYFKVGNDLYRYNSNTRETTSVVLDDLYSMSNIHKANETLFIATTDNTVKRLYKFDENSTDPVLIQEITIQQYGGVTLDNFIQVGGNFYFSARTDLGNSNYTDDLWISDGTLNGTNMVKSFEWDRHWSDSYMKHFVEFEGKLIFKAPEYLDGHIWVSEGTEESTKELLQFEMNREVKPVVQDDQLFFPSNFYELWVTDGTSAGTRVYSRSKLTHGSIYGITATGLTPINGHLYYSAEDEQENGAFWNTSPDSDITVLAASRERITGEELAFSSDINDCSELGFRVRNDGNNELFLSSISVTSPEFFVYGEIPESLLPGETASFEVAYFPYDNSTANGTLTILTDDRDEGLFQLKLNGIPSGEGNNLSSSKGLGKIIYPTSSERDITLSNSSILENSSIGSTIGELSVTDSNGSFEFELIEGTGDKDNSFFTIDGNELRSNHMFDFESRAFRSVRVRAFNEVEDFEASFAINVTNTNELVEFESCGYTTSELNYSLWDIEFIGDNSLMAVGDNTVMRSDDGGDTWSEVETGVLADYIDIEKIGEVIYLLGKYNTIVKSEDNGQNWFPQNLLEESFPYVGKIHFINADRGFAIGFDGQYFSTKDGGENWVSGYMSYYDLSSISFGDETTGYIVGGSSTIMKTEDGGDSWQGLSFFSNYESFTSVHFFDADHGFVLDDEGKLYETTDGGGSWSEKGTANSGYNNRAYFISETEAYVLGSYGVLIKTEDAGVTWEQIDLGNSGTLRAMTHDPSTGKAFVVADGGSYNEGRIIYKLENDTWSELSAFDPDDFFHLALKENAIYAFGNKNFKSTDGGLTWDKLMIGENQTDRYDRVAASYFFDASNGFAAINHEGLYKTEDGGETWNQVSSYDGGEVQDIYFHNESLGFISAGYPHGIYRTTNGGDTWSLASIEPISDYSRVEEVVMLDENTGFALASLWAHILKTTDGGLTWTPLIEFEGKWLHTMHFFNNLEAIALGNDGFIVRSDDGGDTWTEIPTLVGWDFKSVVFTSPEIGFAATNNNGGVGQVLMTTDGGYNWETMWGSDEYHYVAQDGDLILVAGEDGALIRIETQQTPSMPGYVSGSTEVPVNTSIEYAVPTSWNAEYIWGVEGDPIFSFEGSNATVEWDTPGTYTLSVTAYNSCASGSTREVEITVVENPQPEVTGESEVYMKNTEVYTTQLNEGSSYTWYVEGAADYVIDNNQITIKWGQEDTGLVGVIETKESSGARAFDEMIITLTENPNIAPVITGTRVDWNIEQGGSLEIFVSDLIIEDTDNSFPDDFLLIIEESSNYTINENQIIPAPMFVGELTIPVRVSDGIDESETYNIIATVDAPPPLGVTNANELIAYPNPAKDAVRITSKGANQLPLESVSIFDITGSFLGSLEFKSVNNEIKIDLTDLKSGTYILRMNLNDGEIAQVRLIKE